MRYVVHHQCHLAGHHQHILHGVRAVRADLALCVRVQTGAVDRDTALLMVGEQQVDRSLVIRLVQRPDADDLRPEQRLAQRIRAPGIRRIGDPYQHIDGRTGFGALDLGQQPLVDAGRRGQVAQTSTTGQKAPVEIPRRRRTHRTRPGLLGARWLLRRGQVGGGVGLGHRSSSLLVVCAGQRHRGLPIETAQPAVGGARVLGVRQRMPHDGPGRGHPIRADRLGAGHRIGGVASARRTDRRASAHRSGFIAAL